MKNISGRYFIVGCERSGTTLLQSMLASHSRVYSFPESHFFCRAVSRRIMFRTLGVANWRRAQRALSELIVNVCNNESTTITQKRNLFLVYYARLYGEIIDRATLDRGKDIWVEKTPHHLYYIPAIRHCFPEAKFIHVLRDGRDVAASIYDASREDPAYWGKWTAESLANRWNKALKTSLAYCGKSDHILVSYEALIDEPAEELKRICAFMKISFETSMLDHRKSASQVAGWMGKREWMKTIYEPLKDTRLAKFSTLFSHEQQSLLRAQLLFGGEIRRVLDRSSLNTTVCNIR